MNIPKFNAFQKVILCLGALAVALRCFFPVEIYRESDFTSTIFHCIGIVIVTAVVVYLVGILAKSPRVLKIVIITAISITVLMIVLKLLVTAGIIYPPINHKLLIDPNDPFGDIIPRTQSTYQCQPSDMMKLIEEARRRGLISDEEARRRQKQEAEQQKDNK